MNETIVAVFDTAAHAEQAVSDLLAANVPQSAIQRHAAEGSYSPASTAVSSRPQEEGGFWSSLFGGSSTDHDVYDRTLESGGNVVTVSTIPEHDYEAVMAILEKHSPVDIDERAATYTSSSSAMTTGAAPVASGMGGAGMGAMATAALDATTMQTGTVGSGMTGATPTMSAGTSSSGMTTSSGMAGAMREETVQQGGTIQLAEEALAIGKRLVNRGGTRVRRYVVETPVEQNVTLHDEKVTLERRPVTDGRAVTDAAFTDKTIEMTETAEEAVVSKTARVVEEISLGKTATDRTETVRDTLRKEEVEIEQLPGSATTTGTAYTSGTTSGTTKV